MSRHGLGSIRAVTYDCWYTLLVPSVQATGLRNAALRRLLGLDEDAAAKLLEEAWQEHERAWSQRRIYTTDHAAMYCLAAVGVGDAPVADAVRKEFADAQLQAGADVVEGARAALRHLRDENIGRALVCDTFTPGTVIKRILRDAGLLEVFDVLCFSDEIGVPKPARPPFLCALNSFGIAPRYAIHVGDLRRTDVAGASAVGMHTVRYCGVHDDTESGPEADFVIRHHADIQGLTSVNA